MSDNIITIKHLKKHYQALPVLLDINLEVNRGDVISIIGASGSGKSTFLRCLNLLEIPDHGEILYCNKNIFKEELSVKCKNLYYENPKYDPLIGATLYVLLKEANIDIERDKEVLNNLSKYRRDYSYVNG